jgi:hypothetical protein
MDPSKIQPLVLLFSDILLSLHNSLFIYTFGSSLYSLELYDDSKLERQQPLHNLKHCPEI